MRSRCVTASQAETRTQTYSALAGVLAAHPTPESVRAVREMAEGLGLACSAAISASEVEREYLDLFPVSNPCSEAPDESVIQNPWLLPDGQLPTSHPGGADQMIEGVSLRTSTAEGRPCSLQAGIRPDGELPEHVGNELRFMAYTWEREAESPAEEARAWAELRGNSRQTYLLNWIGQVRGRVTERGRPGFYQVVLQVAEAVLRDDRQYGEKPLPEHGGYELGPVLLDGREWQTRSALRLGGWESDRSHG